MKYDLHVHTSRYSSCAVSPPEAVCRTAIKKGLTGIALTEHDVWWPTSEYEELRRLFPELTIFSGAECAVPEGHFLVFLPDPDCRLPRLPDLPGLATEVHRQGGILIWAHPFRYDRIPPRWLVRVRPDALELASLNMSSAVQAMARKTAARWRIPALRNSDAHRAEDVGKYYNEIPAALKNNGDLIEYVKYLL
jgi:predicted metal-dependent phosphoesterase TrpH|uniref:PHP domain-containing protein n=1 Tax=Desulfobacca acetoxidans TaxID=60893 RepID=A0A7C3SI80_9BACT